jgi:hypothetical protein
METDRLATKKQPAFASIGSTEESSQGAMLVVWQQVFDFIEKLVSVASVNRNQRQH